MNINDYYTTMSEIFLQFINISLSTCEKFSGNVIKLLWRNEKKMFISIKFPSFHTHPENVSYAYKM